MSESNDVSEFDPFGFNPEMSDVSWNVSDYINFTGPLIILDPYTSFRILIDDNDPNYNWSITALNNSWCTGSGTYQDPYIIENLYIDGGGSGGMIHVVNSEKFFIIRNCWFNYSGTKEFNNGVLLKYAGNGTIDNNIFTYQRKAVKVFRNSHNNTISNNYMLSDHTTAGLGRAIEIYSSNNVLYNNKIKNYYSPIHVGSSENVTVESNYLENTIHEGWEGDVIVFAFVNYSSITYNTLAGAWALGSFSVNEVDDSSGNTISNNTVAPGGTVVFGPQTSGMVSQNLPQLQQGGPSGVRLASSNHNLVAHNLMLGQDVGEGGGAIRGFDLFIFVGMFGVISILLVIVKRRR
jgi:parallel beta-helix repeat protein